MEQGRTSETAKLASGIGRRERNWPECLGRNVLELGCRLPTSGHPEVVRPVTRGAPRIDGLAAAGNKDATVLELVGAGHAATVAGTHHHGGAPPAFVPGYLEIVDAWIVSHAPGH